MTNDNYTGPYNRVKRLVCLATPTDAQIIRDAAKAARVTVSTFLLVAALEKSKKSNPKTQLHLCPTCYHACGCDNSPCTHRHTDYDDAGGATNGQ